MVIDSDLPPLRAGSLPLIGDNLALDFADAESGRGFASHQNHLRDAAKVLDWLDHARALSPDQAQWLRPRSGPRRSCRRPARERSRAALRHSRRRRSDRSGLRAAASLAREPFRPIRAPHQSRLAQARDRRLRLALERARRAGEAALGTIALAAVDFYEGEFSRIKECGGRASAGFYTHKREQPPSMVRDGGLRQSREAKAARCPEARRLTKLLLALLAAGLLAGCSPAI